MPREDCHIAAVLLSGKAIAVDDEVFWRADGSSFEVAYHATPVRDSAQRLMGIVVTFLDISAQHLADRQYEEMRKQVEHRQRLESLGVLAGGIAHDFNNLLTSIIGNTDLALYYLDKESPAVNHLQRVDKASQHAADLCQQMLAYSGQGQFVMAPLNLSELVQDIGKLLDVSMSKLVSIDYHLASHMSLMHADPSQIQQVVLNLLTNANEAMGDQQGRIIASTGVMNTSPDFLDKCYLKPDEEAEVYVFFEVDDNACGMDEDTIERMFEPFFTTKFTGRGLGMSAVLGIVRSHHGAMRIDSVVGEGTRMRVLFPALKEEQFTAVLPQPENIERGRSYSSDNAGLILVVDDEESLRDIAGMMLEEMGYHVLFAENGMQALEVFAEHTDGIDMVLLDLTMPKMGGEACLKRLKHMRPDVRVLLTSGYSNRVKNTQYEHFLPKPYSRSELAEKLTELMAD
ncbi:MAG: response regulator [Mariprofundaceae bacterium]|nr:response regulator [Mariprofundaceae bacterium]